MNDSKNRKLGHNKKTFLEKPVEHIDITSFDSRKIIESMDKMSFTSRDTAKASGIFNEMFAIVIVYDFLIAFVFFDLIFMKIKRKLDSECREGNSFNFRREFSSCSI